MIASADAIDAAVLDINLQEDPVYPVADALQAHGVPLLFATGYDPTSAPLALRAVPLRQKPIDPPVVARTLFG